MNRLVALFNKYKYLFFDFDGVILDSINVKTEAFGQIYKAWVKEPLKKQCSTIKLTEE